MKITKTETSRGVAVRMILLFLIELVIAGLMVLGYYEVRFIMPKEPEKTEKISIDFGDMDQKNTFAFITEADETTQIETTVVETTIENTTVEKTLEVEITLEETTVVTTTTEPATTVQATSEQATLEPTTPEPTTLEPTTPEPTTPEPTTPEPTTPEPTTLAPTTQAPVPETTAAPETQGAVPGSNSYADDNVRVTVTQNSYGEGNNKVTFYVADIYVSDIRYFGTGLNGNNLWSSSLLVNYAVANPQYVLIANGDNAGYHDQGLVVRNGVIYRNTTTSADQCVLFANGEMRTYGPNQFTAEDAQNYGAWQVWCFGPALLDENGIVKTSFNCTDYIYSTNPRTAIGYFAPGHYCLVVVDGRNPGYSRGVNITELATIMQNLGCKQAYNLDGGYSSSMSINGRRCNIVTKEGRADTDYVIVSTVPLA